MTVVDIAAAAAADGRAGWLSGCSLISSTMTSD